jgi:hypothetical protein
MLQSAAKLSCLLKDVNARRNRGRGAQKFVSADRKGKPWIAIETKSGSAGAPRSGFKYLLERMKFALALQVGLEAKEHVVRPPINGTPVHQIPADQFLSALL